MLCRNFFRSITLSLLLLQSLATGVDAHPGQEQTIAYLSEQIAHHPRQQEWYLLRGIRYLNDGVYNEAKADFDKALQLGSPEMVYLPLGILHYRTGEFTKARQRLTTALEVEPDNAQARYYRSRAALETGDLQLAIEDLHLYLQLNPQPNTADFLALAEMYAQQGQRGIAEALETLDEANRRLGLTPQIQQYAIQLELQRNRPELALGRHLQLQETIGNTPYLHLETARLLHRLNRNHEAEVYLKKAIDQLQKLRPTPARLEALEQAQISLASLRRN